MNFFFDGVYAPIFIDRKLEIYMDGDDCRAIVQEDGHMIYDKYIMSVSGDENEITFIIIQDCYEREEKNSFICTVYATLKKDGEKLTTIWNDPDRQTYFPEQAFFEKMTDEE